MVRLIRSSIFFILFVGGFTSLLAQTGNLYGSGTSDSTVLVRLINAQESRSAVLRLGQARLEAPAPGSMTSYHAIAADIYILRYEGTSREFIPRRGMLYTLVAAGSRGLLILEDEAHNDPARAQIYAYNMSFDSTGLSAAGVSIKTADGQLEVFKTLVPGSSSFRAVNAVRVQLAVFKSDGRRVSTPFELNLARGSSTTVLLLPGAGEVVEVFTVLADIAGR